RAHGCAPCSTPAPLWFGVPVPDTGANRVKLTSPSTSCALGGIGGGLGTSHSASIASGLSARIRTGAVSRLPAASALTPTRPHPPPSRPHPPRPILRDHRPIRAPVEPRAQPSLSLARQQRLRFLRRHRRQVVHVQVAPPAEAALLITHHVIPPRSARRRHRH